MLTKLQIRNFKKLENVELELGNTVVFIGPNNSGKTTALQALALWEIGLRQWIAKRGLPAASESTQNHTPRQRPGVTINRRDLIAIPVPDANLLWRNLHVRKVEREEQVGARRQQTHNIYQAEQTGWALYLEGLTDLAILRTFAEILDHPAATYLERPFVVYVGNVPNEVHKHFWGVREAKADLVGVAIFDRLSQSLPDGLGVTALIWQRRAIENYLCQPTVLVAYARHGLSGDAPLLDFAEIERRSAAMQAAIAEVGSSLETLRNLTPWSPDTKVTDDFLDPLFRRYFGKIGLPNLLRKSDYHILARFLTKEEIALEVTEKLDAIFTVAQSAKPRQD